MSSHLDRAIEEIGHVDYGREPTWRDLDGYDADQDHWAETSPYSDTPRTTTPIAPTTERSPA